MASIDKTIIVDVPLLIAYKQWTRFEDFSRFLAGVKEVRQLDHKRLHWHAEVMGKPIDWFAEVTQKIPGKCITWRNLSGTKNARGVSFQALGPTRTLLTMRVEYHPAGPEETLERGLALVALHVEGDLRRFKKFIEGRDPVDGSWRDAIQDAPVTHASVC